MKLIIPVLLTCISIQQLQAQVNQNPKTRSRATMSGKISDNKGVPLQGVTVYFSDLKTGVASDVNGAYIFRSIPQGHHIIAISHVGFNNIAESIEIGSDITKDYILSESIIENSEVIITGVSAATLARKMSTPITVVRKDELNRNASTNIIESLTKKPGIASVTTGPGISKPVIRGLGYNRVITMNDGIKQEGQQWGDEHGIEIDDQSVSRVEILKGPAALVYGSDALAGVINVITNMPVAEGTVKGNILTNYQTNNNLRALNGNVSGNIKGVNWNVYGSSKRAADYENKFDGKVFNSKFNENNFGGYGGYNGNWGYSHLLWSTYDQRIGLVEGERDAVGYFIKALPNGIFTRADDNDFRKKDPDVPSQRVRHFKVALDNHFHLKRSHLYVNGGYQRNQREEFGNPDDPTETGLYFDLKTYTYTAQLRLPEKNNWAVSFGFNGSDQTNTNRGTEVLIPEYHLNDLGGYAFVKKDISIVSFSGGVRYDNRSLDSKEFLDGGVIRFGSFRKSFSNISGSVGASIKLDNMLTLKMNVARGFRAPSIPELSSNGSHEGTNRFEYGNRNLSSETSVQLDGGLGYASDHFSFDFTGFYNSFNNFIFYRKLSAVNGGDSIVHHNGEDLLAFTFEQRQAALSGFELTFDIHPHPLDWLHIENTFSFVTGKLKQAIEGTRYLPFIPPPRWITDFRGDFLKDGKSLKNFYLKFEIDQTYLQDRIFSAYNTETATPAYTLINVGVGGDLVSKKGLKWLGVYFTGSNMFDVAYQNHLSRLKYASENLSSGRLGVYNMGRNFSVKVDVPLRFE